MTQNRCCIAQVSIVPVALGSSAGTAPFTYYPKMPGNSTSRPAEKEALQSGCMHASRFEGASTHACQVITLDDFMRHHAVTQIDLLKVSALPSSLHAFPQHDWSHLDIAR